MAYPSGISPLMAYQAQPANPVAPGSTSAYTMAGLGIVVSPNTTGKVRVTLDAHILAASATTVDIGLNLQLSYGTGNPPANGAALTGTQIGAIRTYTHSIAPTAVGDVHYPLSMHAIISGLTPGTLYWIDVAQESVTTISDCSIGGINVSIEELF